MSITIKQTKKKEIVPSLFINVFLEENQDRCKNDILHWNDINSSF